MPHMNRIRVNNIKYNFGTQYYDNFMMSLSCKNTIYDLANGGGKSVLMLLLLQNLIPNCTLDEKQPIEKLFRTGSGSTTIHSMIEWRLSDVHIRNNFKYMMTGFCARKAKDAEEATGNKETSSIEYFNYCIFYREYNDNDIKNLPLSNGKERITYTGLRNYLKELEKKNFNLVVKIFDRKGDYQRFISDYGLYESEWEIIRGINKTEGHVRTYFESNYRTTRKVVEDLLIEEIIEKSFNNKYGTVGGGNDMAKTLLDIKDKLLELSKKKSEINNFDRQIEIIDSFADRVQSIKQLYFGKEELETQIVRTYNSTRSQIRSNELKNEQLINERAVLIEHKKESERQLETVKVQKLKSEYYLLQKELDALLEKESLVKKQRKDQQYTILNKESENDYLDYIYYKQERDKIKQTIDHLLMDKGQLMDEINTISNVIIKRHTIKLEEMQTQLLSEENSINKEDIINHALKEDIKRLDRELAIIKHSKAGLEAEEVQIDTRLREIQKQTGIYMTLNIAEELYVNKKKLNEAEESLEQLNLQIKQKEKHRQEHAVRQEINRYQLLENEKEIKQSEEINSQINEDKKRIEKLRLIYGCKEDAPLSDVLYTALHKTGEEIKELELHIKRQKEYGSSLENMIPVLERSELTKVVEYIERYHGDVVIRGTDYIQKKELDQRERLLKKIPNIAYSLIIRRNFDQVIADTRLSSLDLGDYVVSLIDEELIHRDEKAVSDSVFYITKDLSLFTNRDKVNAESSKVLSNMDQDRQKLLKYKEKEKVLKEDTIFTHSLGTGFSEKISQYEEKFRQLKRNQKQLLAMEEDLKEEGYELTQDSVTLEKSLEDTAILINKLKVEIDNYQCLADLLDESESITEKIKLVQSEENEVGKSITQMTERLKASLNQTANRKERCENLSKAIEMIQLEDRKFSLYVESFPENRKSSSDPVKEDSAFLEEYQNLDDDYLSSKCYGAMAALEKETTDLADKQKLINNFDIAMEKTLQAIDYKGIQVYLIEDCYHRHEVTKTDNSTLLGLKKEIEAIDNYLEEIQNKIKEVRSNRDRLDGSMNHAVSIIKEQYKNYEEVPIDADKIDLFIKETMEIIHNDSQKLQNIQKEKELLDQSLQKIVILCKDLERIINDAELNQIVSDQNQDIGINLEDKSKELIKKYDKMLKDAYNKKESFEQDKCILMDTLNKLNAIALSEEIRRSVQMPKTVTDTEQLIHMLKETNACIDMEKKRISKGIQDMERIKEHFENQCLQSCINIKAELDRLPKLSKIVMEGETISIISLQIPYIKEEFYKERMSGYIDKIVSTADTFANPNERLNYIRNQLTWKKLFSVIVTDMNTIRLNLYKRERMKEQSRYLKYEEAVGSTGQSQGIYIQFLIAIIHYISSINAKETNTAKLRNVILIDNPFGAAKDLYIWEPIFKLLKTNHVQLIVPARGVTPAITGRFDVNYVLGQTLKEGKQQTVVIDYYSNIDSEEIEYTTLSYKQTSLF